MIGTIFLAKHLSSSSENDDNLSSSDDELFIIYKSRQKHSKIKGFVNEVVPNYDGVDFRSHFRLTREKLLTDINFKPVSLVGKPPIKPLDALFLTLWTLANQECFRSIADRFGFSRGHAHNIFIKTLKTICLQQEIYIKWPQGEELLKTVNDFNKLRGDNSFPNVVGCVDGTHILIAGPRNDDSFYNRKGTHSMILQGICNAKMEFINVYCGWPGSAHDARVWKHSPIYANLNTYGFISLDYHLLGDTAYPLDNFVLVPFKDNGHLTQQQKKYNLILSSTRVCIEQSYGRLKGIWRRLKYLNIGNLTYFKYIVVAACILHNIIIREYIECDYDYEEDNQHEYIDNHEENLPILAQNKRNMIMNSL